MGKMKLSIQPAYDYKTNTIGYAEVLIREYKGIQGVENILKYVEETGTELEFDSNVLDETIRYIRKYPNISYPIGMNLCGRTMELKDSSDKIIEIIKDSYIPLDKLVIEINEKTDFSNPNVADNLKKLHAAELTLALDDFGTSNSNFIALLGDAFSILKIDKAFVDYLNEMPDENEMSRGAILETIVSLCKKLGLRSIIEGVESNKQLVYTKQIGCDCVQGYIISKPVPINKYKS